jgi:hypothetical protein
MAPYVRFSHRTETAIGRYRCGKTGIIALGFVSKGVATLATVATAIATEPNKNSVLNEPVKEGQLVEYG